MGTEFAVLASGQRRQVGLAPNRFNFSTFPRRSVRAGSSSRPGSIWEIVKDGPPGRNLPTGAAADAPGAPIATILPPETGRPLWRWQAYQVPQLL
jgi:hypothetical protein